MDGKVWSMIEIDAKLGKVTYLGYELGLTPDEYALIYKMIDSCGEVDDREFIEILSPKRLVTHGNIAVHVCNINKKAMAVGGRRIIVKRRHHYIFNDEL